MPFPLISTWATIPLDWGQIRPKYAPLSCQDKYSYLQLQMGVACSPNIFQAKMSELMATLEFIQTYLDHILCISKGNLDDHLAKL